MLRILISMEVFSTLRIENVGKDKLFKKNLEFGIKLFKISEFIKFFGILFFGRKKNFNNQNHYSTRTSMFQHASSNMLQHASSSMFVLAYIKSPTTCPFPLSYFFLILLKIVRDAMVFFFLFKFILLSVFIKNHFFLFFCQLKLKQIM